MLRRSRAHLRKLPAGSGYYVHVNVRQFLGAPVVRKAIPMAVDKYSSNIMDLVQFAKAFDPNAAAVLSDYRRRLCSTTSSANCGARRALYADDRWQRGR